MTRKVRELVDYFSRGDWRSVPERGQALAEGAVDVAAVLAAAAVEDTIRRMGNILAGVHERPKLADVLVALNNIWF